MPAAKYMVEMAAPAEDKAMKWIKTAGGYASGQYAARREMVYASRRPWHLLRDGVLIASFHTLAALKRNAERHAATGCLIGQAAPVSK
jgi:hypothetical protein